MDADCFRPGIANDEAVDNAGEVVEDDVDVLSVGSCHLEEEKGDDEARVATDNSMPGPSRKGMVDEAGWGEISIFFSHRQRREKRKYDTVEDVRRHKVKSSAKRMALGLTVGEEPMNDTPTRPVRGEHSKNTSSSGSIIDAQLQQILMGGRMITRWHCTICPEGSEVYDTVYGLSARLHAVYHLSMAHGKDTFQLMALRERERIQHELKMVLKFQIKTQDDICGFNESEDPVAAVRIESPAVVTAVSKSQVAMFIDETNEEAADLYICFCYKAMAERGSFIRHLAEDHDIFLRNSAEVSDIESSEETANTKENPSSQNDQKCTEGPNRDVKSVVASLYEILASDVNHPVRWKCRFCSFLRISKSYTVHLRVIYHLISSHSIQIQDPLIDRAIGENMFVLVRFIHRRKVRWR